MGNIKKILYRVLAIIAWCIFAIMMSKESVRKIWWCDILAVILIIGAVFFYFITLTNDSEQDMSKSEYERQLDIAWSNKLINTTAVIVATLIGVIVIIFCKLTGIV